MSYAKEYIKWPKLYSGTYAYLKGEHKYAEEAFVVFEDPKSLCKAYHAETLTHVEDMASIKTIVYRIYDNEYYMKEINVKKNIGGQFCEENYNFDSSKNELYYSFQNQTSSLKEKIKPTSNFNIVTPDFTTSMIFILNRKLSPESHIDQYFFISPNQLQYQGPLESKRVYAERNTVVMNVPLEIGKVTIAAGKIDLFESEKKFLLKENKMTYFVSKQMGIPLKLETGTDLGVVVTKMHDIKEKIITRFD